MDTLTSSQAMIGQDFLVEIKVKGATKHKYKGLVTGLNYSKTSTSSNHIAITGTSPSFQLDDHEYCKSFLDKKLNSIVSEVLGNYSVANKVNPSFKEKIPFSVQYRETAYGYLKRLADHYGQWFYYDGEKVIFGEKEKALAVKVKLGDDLINYGINLNTVQINDVSKSYDYLKDETYDSKSQEDKISSLDKFSQEVKGSALKTFPNKGNDIVPPRYTEKEQLEKYQEDMKGGIISNIHEFSGSSRNPSLKLGGSINVKGTTQKGIGKGSKGIEYDVGKFTLIGISHYVNNNGEYTNDFTAVPEEYKYPPKTAVRYPRANAQTAIVIDNADEEEKMGRIKVRFPWMEPDEETPWIRISAFHATKDNGHYFVPEIDDQVLVDFELGCPDLPIVISSLFHGKAKPEKWYHKNNELKAIKTRSGNEILFDDKSGKETIKIFSPDEKNIITLTMDESKRIKIVSDGYIEISAKKDMSLSANNISITARKKITTSCKTFDNSASDDMIFSAGKNIESSAGKELSASSGMGTSLSAGTQYQIEGMNVDIAATAKLDMSSKISKLSGSVTADVDSKMTTVSGTGVTTIKGGLVKIN